MSLPCIVPAGWVEPPECEPDDEAARLTGPAARRDDDAWHDGMSDFIDSDSDDEARRRKRTAAPQSLPIMEREDARVNVAGDRGALVK